MAETVGMLCRPTVFFATAFFRVQALRNVFCSLLSARFSDNFTVVLDDLLLIRVHWKVLRFWRFVVGQGTTLLCARLNRDFGFGSKSS